MNSCPNCGKMLAYPLSDCRGGQCPFCGYKPQRTSRNQRETRKRVAIRKKMRSLGLSDAQIDAVIRVYNEAGNVIETHEHKGDFKEW
jgi:DNA-directed RNA polymerase subunit M/transcription elongation factor TFIIS